MRKGYYMNFNNHSNLEGCHAFLGASQYHWINYDEEKLADSYTRKQAVLRGTVLHDFAAQCIRLRQKLPDIQQTLNMDVNDAVGFKMTPEQILYYSDNCFGTADAICFLLNCRAYTFFNCVALFYNNNIKLRLLINKPVSSIKAGRTGPNNYNIIFIFHIM